MAKQDQVVTVPAIKVDRIQLTVVGDSPLICNRWSDKAKRQILDKQMKKAKGAKEAKDPEEQFRSSLYQIDGNGRYGFPAIGFKGAMVSACRLVDDLTMTEARQMFHVIGEMVEIRGEPRMREDMVRLQGKTADIRFRGEFPEWEADILITFARNAISAEQIVNLMNLAGFSVGVGEWRPEKNGPYGRFHVKSENE